MQKMLHLEVTIFLGRTNNVTLTHARTLMIHIYMPLSVGVCVYTYENTNTHAGLMFTNQSLSVIIYVTSRNGSRT
jgi:hypothetical protein